MRVSLVLGLACSGCQSTPSDQDSKGCKLTTGMTTAELAGCGCFSTNQRTPYANGLSEPGTDPPVQDVSILSYFCPRGNAGFARVMVRNGIASDVYQ